MVCIFNFKLFQPIKLCGTTKVVKMIDSWFFIEIKYEWFLVKYMEKSLCWILYINYR